MSNMDKAYNKEYKNGYEDGLRVEVYNGVSLNDCPYVNDDGTVDDGNIVDAWFAGYMTAIREAGKLP
jgi:hypothetical protein